MTASALGNGPAEAAPSWRTVAGFASANAYVAVVAWLLLFVAVPALVLRWEPMVITSGSMTPSIRAGDVVLVTDPPAATLGAGTVITFEDRRGALVTHRIAAVTGDGDYVTRGDANGVDDSDRVRPSDVVGVGRLLVPMIGLPWVWVGEGRLLVALLWLVATVLATLASATPEDLRARRRPGRAARWARLASRARAAARRRLPAGSIRLLVATGLAAGIALPLVAGTFSTSAFTARATNAGNGWQAAARFEDHPTRYFLQAAPSPATGDQAAALVLPMSRDVPTGSELYNLSTGRGKPEPGRALHPTPLPPVFDDPARAAVWRTPAATTDVHLDGPVRVDLHARILSPPRNKQHHALVVRLFDLDPATGARTLLGARVLHRSPFSPGDAWAAIGTDITVDRVVPAGHHVELHVQATRRNPARDVHLAFDTVDHPAAVTLPARID